MKTCKMCDNTGKYAIANGPDDSELVYCSCVEGNRVHFFEWLAVEKAKLIAAKTV